jgi:hypothetical protein
MDVEGLGKLSLSCGIDPNEPDGFVDELVGDCLERRRHRFARPAGWGPEVENGGAALLAHQLLQLAQLLEILDHPTLVALMGPSRQSSSCHVLSSRWNQ